MNKIIAFCIALVLVLTTSITAYAIMDQKLDNVPIEFIRESSLDEKYGSPEIITKGIDKSTLVVMGSSELNADRDKPFFPFNVYHDENMNLMKIGRAGYQSLIHAGIMGSIGDKIPNKKAVFIISPQWFTKRGVSSRAVPSKLSLEMVDGFLSNDKISKQNKDRFIKRVSKLTKKYSGYHDQLMTLVKSYQSKDPSVKMEAKAILLKDKTRREALFLSQYKKIDPKMYSRYKIPYNEYEKYSFEEKIKQSEQRAEKVSTNNIFAMENSYYNQHVKRYLKKYKNMQRKLSYLNSPEYEDMQLYLDVAKDLGIEVHLISMPVHGPWVDYMGLSKSNRQAYYQNIRNIADKNGLSLLDLSEHEYDRHFIRDMTHLGEKGWLYIDEDLARFYHSKK